MTTPFPPHPTDDPRRMAAVLAYVARGIGQELRRTRRRKVETMTTARILAALPATPLPHAIEKLFADIVRDALPPRAIAGAAADLTPTAAPLQKTPDFSPDFLSNVKQLGPVIRRDGCADILGVSLDWFGRAAPGLMAAYGFPAPRDATGQKRWDCDAVAAWSLTETATKVLARARAAHAKTKAGKP